VTTEKTRLCVAFAPETAAFLRCESLVYEKGSIALEKDRDIMSSISISLHNSNIGEGVKYEIQVLRQLYAVII
jgi:hypothetical protein